MCKGYVGHELNPQDRLVQASTPISISKTSHPNTFPACAMIILKWGGVCETAMNRRACKHKYSPMVEFLQQRSVWEQVCKQPGSQVGSENSHPQSPVPRRDPRWAVIRICHPGYHFHACLGAHSLESGPPKGRIALLKLRKQHGKYNTGSKSNPS